MASEPPRQVPSHRRSSGYFFFLSAATPDSPATGDEHWVGVFYRDLSAVVSRLRCGTTIGIGYHRTADDDQAAVAAALSTAEVFVALYSEEYLVRPRALRELQSFARRLAASPQPNRQTHLVTVLWEPMPTWLRPPELTGAAVDVGAGIEAYDGLGLRALCRLHVYREQYQAVLERLAAHIVRVAEQSPIGPSTDPVWVEPVLPEPVRTSLVIATLAPTLARRPAGRIAEPYGSSSVLWRPFGATAPHPIAGAVALAGERIGLAGQVVDFAAHHDLLGVSPSLVLIDPWVLPDGDITDLLVKGVRKWVPLVVVADEQDPQYRERGAALARDTTDMLLRSGDLNVRTLHSADEFQRLAAKLVNEARSRYLDHLPTRSPNNPTSDPQRIHRLAGAGQSIRFASAEEAQ